MEIDFNFEGFPETLRAIDALPGLLAERVQGDGLLAAARVTRDEARKLVPVRTGALQRTIRARRVSQRIDTGRGTKRVPGAAAQVLAGQSGRTTRGRSRTAVRHAVVVEYGLIRNRADRSALSRTGTDRDQDAPTCRSSGSYAKIVSKDSTAACWNQPSDEHHAAASQFLGETYGDRRLSNHQRNQCQP